MSEDSRDKLSKAMGAAFLAHRVQQLEHSVEAMQFSRDPRLYNPHTARQSRKDGQSSSRPAQKPATAAVSREVRVVDTSVMVYGLPLLRRWIRENKYQLIVPLSVISTLDSLKKSPGRLNDLAREATGFLERQIQIAKRITDEATAATPRDENPDAKIRLRIQRASEELSWPEASTRFQLPEGFVVLPVEKESDAVDAELEEEEEEELALPTAADLPRAVKPILLCSLYFQTKGASSLLLLGSDPLDAAAPFTTVDSESLSSGAATSHWANFFNVQVQLVQKAEVQKADEYLKAQALAASEAARRKEDQERSRSSGSQAGQGSSERGGRRSGAPKRDQQPEGRSAAGAGAGAGAEGNRNRRTGGGGGQGRKAGGATDGGSARQGAPAIANRSGAQPGGTSPSQRSLFVP